MLIASRSRRRQLVVHLFAAIALLAAALFWPTAAGAQTATLADITTRDQLIYNQESQRRPGPLVRRPTRDQLIYNQESLLNVYRCRFGIDTQVVAGGCADGRAALPAARPDPFAGTPTSDEVHARDSLIASQESLLNAYRCRFNVDTQVVPGGCANGHPVEPDTVPIEANASTTIAAGFSHFCAIKADDSIACWGSNGYGETDAPPGQYTAITASSSHSCAITTDNTIACWGQDSPADPPPGQFIA